MKHFIFPILVLSVASCSSNSGTGDALTSDTLAAAPVQSAPAEPAGPAIQFFSYTDSVTAVVDGAGCGYGAPGGIGDSSLFAFAEDGVIRVGGGIEILKMVGEGTFTDSTGESRWENPRYRLDLRTVDDSTYAEVGVSQHGEMTVEDKRTGGKTTVAIAGYCGC